jgi:tetratricopeptide (TPR) repeat protein
MLNILLMSPPFGVGWEVWIAGAIAIGIALIGGMWKLANWKGRLDQWKESIDDWRNSVDNQFDKLAENINTLMSDVAVIKADSEKNATRNGMIQRHSPLVPSKKAIEILEELNIISQVDANISYIKEEIEKRSQTSIYRDIEDSEERFIEIAPSVIHALIKKGKIEEKNIDEAMRKLEEVFPVVTYYGVLLLIVAYILEKGKGKYLIAKPSMIYSQIDIIASKDQDEVLASFGGDTEKAIKSLEMSIRTLEELDNKEELAGAHKNLGNLLKDMGRTEEAEAEYRDAIRINPKSAVAHYNLGNLLKDRGRKAEAEVEYRDALRIDSDFAKVHINLGNLLYDMERKEEAEAEYRDAIRINPDYVAAHYNLGNLLKDMGRKAEAEVEYRDAIRINPDYVAAHINLGNLLYDMERKEEAEAEYREALRINPDYAEAHINLGNSFVIMNRKEEAEAEYQEALRINPDYAEAHANLGVLYSKTGSKEEAKKELQIAKRFFDEQGREADVKKTEELLKSL